MNYFRQLLTVTLWEYKRFYKIKNELLGIAVLLGMGVIGYYGGSLAVGVITEKGDITIAVEQPDKLAEILSEGYTVTAVPVTSMDAEIEKINTRQEGVLLWKENETFVLHAWKEPARMDKLREYLGRYHQQVTMARKGISQADMDEMMSDAPLETRYQYVHRHGKTRLVAFFFAGIMVMAVFISFAYQFTAITGEKQLRITEQIVSAIKPQVWMDGKILGITLTSLSSMISYVLLSIIGGIVLFIFTDQPVSAIGDYLYPGAMALYFLFTFTGILLWNSVLAAVASIITDPNNSGKGSLMMLPSLFVLGSMLVLANPDNGTSVFLSWFPLTSATAMPMRWLSTPVAWWEVAGSLALLAITFYFLRKLAAKIFRVSILISGKEPGWGEVIKLARES